MDVLLCEMGVSLGSADGTECPWGTFALTDSGWTLGQVSQRGCPIFTFGDTQNLTVHSPEQPAVADSALSKGLDDLQRCLPASAVLWFCNCELGAYNPIRANGDLGNN